MYQEKQIFIDMAKPFALRSTPKVFSVVADMLFWAIKERCVGCFLHYLNDFLIMGTSQAEVGRALDTAVVPNSAKEDMWTYAVLVFLSIEIT